MNSIENVSPAKSASGVVTRAVDDAGARAHGAIDKMAAAAVPAVNRMSGGAHQAVDGATQFASGAAESIADRADRVQAAQSRVADECRGYVRANPLAAVGMAVAAGYVLGRLLSSR